MRTLPLLLLGSLAGCVSASSPGAPAGEPLVRGPVESITHHATASGILVRALPGSREPCGILAVVDARTRYLRRTGSGGWRPAAAADLQVGDTVEVFVQGPVADSCPVQGQAAAIVLAPGAG